MQLRRRNWPPIHPLTFKPPNGKRQTSIREFKVDGGDVIVAMFQGSRGERPALDIIVKYLQRGKTKLRTPAHVHWAVDLLIKKSHDAALTVHFVKFLMTLYDDIRPFESDADRLERPLICTSRRQEFERFLGLNEFGEYSIEFTCHIMELLAIQEKTGSPDAFMFREALSGTLGGRDIFQIISTARHRGN